VLVRISWSAARSRALGREIISRIESPSSTLHSVLAMLTQTSPGSAVGYGVDELISEIPWPLTSPRCVLR